MISSRHIWDPRPLCCCITQYILVALVNQLSKLWYIMNYTIYPEALKYDAAFSNVMFWHARSIKLNVLSNQLRQRKALIEENACSMGL